MIICEIIVHLLVIVQNKKIHIKSSTLMQEKLLRGIKVYVLLTSIAPIPVVKRSKAEVSSRLIAGIVGLILA